MGELSAERSARSSVEPGDLLNVVRTLRRFLTACDDTRYVVDLSFADIDERLEKGVKDVRDKSTRAADAVYAFLAVLEAHPIVVERRREIFKGVKKT